MSASVPGAGDLVGSAAAAGGGIAAALGASAAKTARQAFSLPLALIGNPDPLTPAAERSSAYSRADLDAASAFVYNVRGTLTARVQSLRWAGHHLRPAVGQQVWFATAEGWWSTSAEPQGYQAKDTDGRRVRLTPVQPDQFAASLAPMLTSAFGELAAASWRARAGAEHVDQAESDVRDTVGEPEMPARGGDS